MARRKHSRSQSMTVTCEAVTKPGNISSKAFLIRVEIGPRDIANGTVSIARRDEPPKQKHAMSLNRIPRNRQQNSSTQFRQIYSRRQLIFGKATHPKSIAKMKYQRSLTLHSRTCSGFAYVHVADDPAVAKALDPLKVTVRCTPMDWEEEPGKCLFTGKTVSRRSVISRSY